ncbi:MAG TPA: hypothetical protein VEA63_12265, partial [Opitutus sp.]|nr:hypothetical protein [Opitutus sp.]
MRNETDSIRANGVRSMSAGRKFAGGSGRIASAGGRRTAVRTAPHTPVKAAHALTATATTSTFFASTNSNSGKR